MRPIVPIIFVILLTYSAFPQFGNAQPPFGGGDRGGDRGGSPWGGGPPGGGSPWGGGDRGGGRGGDRGGFDPSSMIEGLDKNKNGMLDPDEMQGPAQFMISRLQRDDPSIRSDKPIPMSKFREGFDKMRGDRDRDRGGNGGDDEARKAAEQKVNEAMIVTPLVPGFGEPDQDLMLEPLLGFGSAAEMMAVEVTPKDQQDAEENLRRSDRNGDGVLSGDEISSRWSGNPMDFDRNGDKKLSLNELAIRTARKRVVESSPAVKAVASKSDGKKDSRRDDPKAQEPKDLYNGRKSYLTNVAKLPEGLPGWFAARDRNGDRQVEMSEYADSWNNAVIAEFNQFDRSGDGVVTVQECMTAVESGASASSVASTPAPSPSTPPASSSTPSSSTPSSSTPSSSTPSSSTPSSLSAAPSPTTVATTSAAAPSGGSILPVVEDEKLIKYAQKIIGRYDTNGDGALTASEWQTMLVNPQAADANKDGRVTIPEYAASMASRSAR